MTSNMCPSCVSWNEFNDQHKQMRWVEHRAKMGGLSLTQTRYFYMLGPRWSAGCSNFHGEFNSFEDSTCKCHKCKAIQATDIPKQKKHKITECTKWCHFFVRHKTKPGPFCDHPGNEPMVTTSAANTFLSQPQKSPNISLLAGFPAATVSFVEEKTKENYDESKPYSPTLSRSHHFLVKVLSKVIT